MACSESNTFFLSKLHASCLINQVISPYFIRIIPTIVDNLSVFLKIGKIPHRISALIVDNPWIFFIFGIFFIFLFGISLGIKVHLKIVHQAYWSSICWICFPETSVFSVSNEHLYQMDTGRRNDSFVTYFPLESLMHRRA